MKIIMQWKSIHGANIIAVEKHSWSNVEQKFFIFFNIYYVENLEYAYILACIITTKEIHLLKEQQLESATLPLKKKNILQMFHIL